ncbi:MAG: EamA family transporter, partial [Microgenomates group bacterium]
MTWLLFAFLSAFFAALTSILAKIGVKDVNSNLATAIRTVVILIFAWGIVFFQNTGKDLANISKISFIFLILSGVATGLSWLFYFRALQLGEASKVVPIDKLSLVLTIILSGLILKEKITLPILIG